MRTLVGTVGLVAAVGFLLSVSGVGRIAGAWLGEFLPPARFGEDWRGQEIAYLDLTWTERLLGWLIHPWHPNRVLVPGFALLVALVALVYLIFRILEPLR